MKIYRVKTFKISVQDGEAAAYHYFSSKREARRLVSEYGEQAEEGVEEFDFPISKQGMLDALNELGGHADNG